LPAATPPDGAETVVAEFATVVEPRVRDPTILTKLAASTGCRAAQMRTAPIAASLVRWKADRMLAMLFSRREPAAWEE
jgi:hypothetical protein